ncbi:MULTISPECIES: AraC family transcriptional regulator [Actinoplanes]|uniref:AraC family transcriptional regulator n=1 Tax=Actinoplanes TaxID=1865 RepID=UPI0005F28BC9|nr:MULTISPECIES: AraC family transcriptional regulator [Actinoplanes]
MDVISEAVEALRIGRAYGRRIETPVQQAGRFAGFEGVGFHVILRGHGWLISEELPPLAVGPGDIALAPYGAPHGFATEPVPLATLPLATMGPQRPPDGPVDMEFICGAYRLDDGGTVHPYLRSLPAVVTVTPDGRLAALVEVLAAEMDTPRTGTEVTRPAVVDLMLIHVLRLWNERAPEPSWPALADPGIAAALRSIHESPQEQWTVAELSRAAGLSRTAFTRRFTTLVGTPPMTYLISRRLTRGAQLLRESDAPLSAVARRVGYASEFAFAGAFRREFGMAPGRFRRALHAPDGR